MAVLPCQLMFGVERGEQIRDLLEAATGELCRCKVGRRCPLMEPQDDAVVIPLRPRATAVAG